MKIQEFKLVTPEQDTRTFEINPAVHMYPVRFSNRYGIELAGHLYVPEGADSESNNRKYPALVIAGPFGAVKEQAAGLYAQKMASLGFVTLAFDPSFCGESDGKVRNTASPDIFTEDFSAAVDFIGLLDIVDRNRIGAIGICGLSGMAITAAAMDPRIKAVATCSMYDMSRDMSKGHLDYYTKEQRREIRDYLAAQRWKDAESGTFALGNHEIGFDEEGNLLTAPIDPSIEPGEDADPAFKAFYNYYVKRARHPRAVNFVSAWTATMPWSFWEYAQMTNLADLEGRPLLLVAGENAHSRYYSEDVYRAAPEPKELLIIPEADHVDLYDNMDKIPFEKLDDFFKTNLK